MSARKLKPCPGCNRARSTCWIMPCLYVEQLLSRASDGREHGLKRWASAVGVTLQRRAAND